MGDWLGTGTIAPQKRKFWSYEKSSQYLVKHGVTTRRKLEEIRKEGKLPKEIPTLPERTYRKQGKWRGYGHFFGTGEIASFNKKFRTFKDARKFARSLKLKNWHEWVQYAQSSKKPVDIPSNPLHNYRNKGWKGWPDFLGNIGRIANQNRVFWSYEKASAFLIKLGVENKDDFFRKCKSGKIPKEIPRNTERVYKKQGTWITWGDFLGTGRIANQKVADTWLSAKEARIAIRKIAKEVFGWKPFTPKDWVDAHKAGKIPANLPRYLQDIYNPDVKKRRNERRKKK